jgi:hypothetical protein
MSMPVRFGASIKLRHAATGGTLRSYLFVSGRLAGSGQDPVTCWDGPAENDLWRVKGPHGRQPDTRRTTVVNGDVVRLEQLETGKNLHSHADYPSPVSSQQEVTCFGEHGIGDAGDDWRVEVEGGGDWNADARVRLVHLATGRTLGSQAGLAHPQWTRAQQEVAGVAERTENDLWQATGFLVNDACFVGQMVPPSIEINQTMLMQLTMRNLGTGAWSAEAGHRLGSQNPPDNLSWGRNRVPVPGLVPPGEEVTMAVPLTAPGQRGPGIVQWRMVQEGGWFGDLTPPVTVNAVLPGGPATVPDVRGAVKVAAVSAVRAAGLEVRLTGSTGRDGMVVSQSPPPHSVVDRGSTVVLHMQTG